MRKVLVVISIGTLMMLGMRGVFAGSPRIPNNTTSPIGTNFHFFSDWSSEYVFINAFRMARPWITSNWDDWDTFESNDLANHLDANGYPTQLPSANDSSVLYRHATTLMFNDLKGQYPGGEYLVLYDGEGKLAYGRDVAEIVHTQPGQDVIRVVPNNGIVLRIIETTPGNHLRNIRVIMPGYTPADAETQIYHDHFLDAIDQFRVLRFMDWMRTNWDEDGPIDRSNTNTNIWSERALPTDAFYTTSAGLPVEVMVDLSNTVHADPWFTLSHLATDSDMQQFAQLVHDTLSPDRRVYLEYSNEVWNYGFTQGTWIEQKAKLDGQISSNGTDFQRRLSWYGKRSTEMCSIWKTVWGAESDRITCTIATQAANPWVGEQMLDCPLWSGGPCYDKVDAVAIAPYFGQHIGMPAYRAEVKAWTNDGDGGLNKLFQEMEFGNVLTDRSDQHINKTTVSKAISYTQAYKSMADARGIAVVSYEGGQHLAGIGGVQNDQDIHYLFMEANKDPRMKTLYETYLAGWHDTGAQFFLHYANSGLYTNWGYWGAKEFLNEPLTPKQEAVETHIASTPCDWSTCSLGGSGTVTAVALQAQNASKHAAKLWLLIPILLLTVAVLRHRKLGLLLCLFLFVGCQPSVVEPAAVESTTPVILDFVSDVTDFLPGVPILLSWDTEGVSSMQLRTMTFDNAGGGVSEQAVNADGSLLITPALQRAGSIVFELYNTDAGLSRVIEIKNLCSAVWVFLPAPDQCSALPQIYVDAVTLPFEHGYMMYIPSLSSIWVTTTDGSLTWTVRDTYDPLVDMFEDPTINPPLLSNFYEPTAAMGKVWREEPGVRDALGWSTFILPLPYIAIIQCTNYTRDGFCMMNSAPLFGFNFRFSRDPIWNLDFNGLLNP